MKSFPLAEFFSFDIAPYCSTAKFESGQSILKEGSETARLYYLSEGRAKLFLTHENGRTSLVSFLDLFHWRNGILRRATMYKRRDSNYTVYMLQN